MLTSKEKIFVKLRIDAELMHRGDDYDNLEKIQDYAYYEKKKDILPTEPMDRIREIIKDKELVSKIDELKKAIDNGVLAERLKELEPKIKPFVDVMIDASTSPTDPLNEEQILEEIQNFVYHAIKGTECPTDPAERIKACCFDNNISKKITEFRQAVTNGVAARIENETETPVVSPRPGSAASDPS